MKKLLIVLLLFAFAASGVFADVSFSGQGFGTWDVVTGTGGEGPGATGPVEINPDGDLGTDMHNIWDVGGTRLRFAVDASNEEKTAGLFYQLRLTESAGPYYGYVWWNPIEMFKITLGFIDGQRPFGVIWGVDFNDAAGNAGLGGGGSDIFSGIAANHGAIIQIRPISNLEVAVGANIGIGDGAYGDAYDVYARTQAYVGYTIEGIGVAALGFNSNTGYWDATTSGYNNPNLELAFNLTAIENLTAQLGVHIPFASKSDGIDSAVDPIKIALAASYGSDLFGINAHLKTTFGEKVEVAGFDDPALEGPFSLGVTLTPWYNLGIGKVGLSAQFAFAGTSRSLGTDNDDDTIKWEVSPYFEKPFSGGSFLVGFRIGGSNYTNDKAYDDGTGSIYWGIPVGILYSF
jgi:hypothetical protein